MSSRLEYYVLNAVRKGYVKRMWRISYKYIHEQTKNSKT